MRNINYISKILLALVLMAASSSLCAQEVEDENILTVPDFEASITRTVNVPIYLDNTQEVVAVQFDIQLPFNVPSDGTPNLSNRATQHSVTINAKGGKTFSVVVMSAQNVALRGNSGLLLRLPMSAYDDGNTATPYEIRLTNIVLTDIHGNNIATESTATGHFIVSRTDLPDLTVTNIAPSATTAQPNGAFTATYRVNNEGQGATLAGWTEKVYFESSITGERVYIGCQSYTGTLSAGASLQRTYQTMLPALVHADGEQYVYVEIVPDANAGELVSDQANNSGISVSSFNLGKQLTLTAGKLTLKEGYWSSYYLYRDNITLTLSRSGDWSTAESFPLTCSVDGLLYVGSESNTLSSTTPRMITIPAKSASTTLYLYATDDNIVRAKEADLFIGEANDYNGATLHINRTDNDTNPLSLSASLSQMTEGTDETLTLTATRGGELTDELTLTVNCNQSQRFEEETVTITIPVGQTTGTAVMTLTDDQTPQLDCDATFSVRATDYKSASTTVRLLDNDRPQLTMTLLPATVNENDGQQATTVVIRRDRGEGQAMTVYLGSSSASNVFFNESSITFGVGETEKTVAVGVADNSAVDGTRSYTLTAACYLSANGQTAPSGNRSYASATITVVDDETPYLRLSSGSNYVGEGSSFTVTVKRVVANASSAQTVTLTADLPDDVTMPATVTIPAGNYSTTATVSVKRNSVTDDERTLTISAEADGLTMAQMSVNITDRTLPDAVPSDLSVLTPKLYSNMEVSLSVNIANTGTNELPAGMKVDFFLANSSRLYSYTTQTTIMTATTTTAVTAGGSQTMQFAGTMPSMVGTYWLFARVNADNAVAEFSTSNNLTSTPVQVTIAAPFSVTSLATDADNYLPGGTVVATGVVSSLIESGLTNQYVNVTMEGSGQSRKTVTCQVDPVTGEYRAIMTVSASAAGLLTIKARAQGQTEADMSTTVNVWNMSLTADNSRWTLNENYPQTGKLTLRNTSGKAITGLKIERTALPYGCELNELTLQKNTLAAGESMNISYNVNGTQPMTSGQYATFTVTASCSEGVAVQLPISYYCRATDSRLMFEYAENNTTLMLQSTRTVQLKVTNYGLKATGKIQLIAPENLEWLTCQTAGEMASIAPGESSYISVRLTHREGMHSGSRYIAAFTLIPETGPQAGCTLNTTIVGTEYSKLNVSVSDVYVKARQNYVKVSAAQVTVTKQRTGETVLTGLTDGNGHWETSQITEGTYYVTVKAPRHKSVRQTLIIGPGDERSMQFFLPYQAVVTDFVTNQNSEDGSYTMKSYIDIDRAAPQAIVVPEMPENGYECGEQTFDITLRNVGVSDAFNVRLTYPGNVPNTTFSVGAIPVIKAGSEAVVTVNYTGPEQGNRRMIAKIGMHYEWLTGGETLSEDDSYQALVGCMYTPTPDPGPYPPNPPVILPKEPDTPGETENTQEEEETKYNIILPTINSSMELVFDDIRRITTGTPFYATLKVANGQQAALQNILFSHYVSDDSDDYETDMTTRFDLAQTIISGFTGSANRMSLAGGKEGVLKLQFTPTAEAAPEGSHTYYLGGKLSYTDAATGGASQVSLAQIIITVTQQGKISVTYLMQNDFAGDSPATEQITESGVPGQFVALVRNTGAANVNDLHLYAQEPVVVNNATMQEVTAQPLYTGINNQPNDFTLSDLNITTVEAGTTSIARHIVQYTQDSRLLQGVSNVEAAAKADVILTVGSQRKLFRAVNDADSHTASGDMLSETDNIQEMATANVFLLDDEEDEDRLPDHVMTAEGEETALILLDNSQITLNQSATQASVYTLTINSTEEGWAYGSIINKVLSKMHVKSVTKGGKNISAANFWQTDHTILSDYSSFAEDRLHFADKVVAGENVYTITLEPKGSAAEIIETKFYAEDGSEQADGQVITQKMGKIVIAFTQEVSKFYLTGYSLYINGIPYSETSPTNYQSAGAAANYWVLDFTGIPAMKGEFHLVFSPKKVQFKNGTKGSPDTIDFTWTQDITPQSQVDILVEEEGYGTVDKESGMYNHGELVLTATPNKGYQFVKWMEKDRDIESDGTMLTIEVKEPTTLRAIFAPVELVLDGMVVDAANDNIWHPQYNGEATDDQFVKYAVHPFNTPYPVTVNYVPAASDLIAEWVGDTENLYRLFAGSDYSSLMQQMVASGEYEMANVFAPLAAATYSVRIGASGYATFCAPCPLSFEGVSGMTAYTATVNGQWVVLTPVTTVPAQTGVILKGDAGTYTVKACEQSATTKGELTGTIVRTIPDAGNNYVLSTDSNGENVGFYQLPIGGAVQANRAYLTVADGNAPVLGLCFEDVTTIRTIHGEGVMVNGYQVYDLQGRKVSNDYRQDGTLSKGLYIVNGKKMIIK